MDFIKEVWDYFKERKKYWLIPIVLILMIMGGLIIVSQGTTIAPFIYTIF
tara:strand:- start:180 stop:329 length:150 start_codon:yes stop_codon:yes gene_type:complete